MTRFTEFANLALCFPISACDFWMKDNKTKAKKCQEGNMDSITLLLRTMFALK